MSTLWVPSLWTGPGYPRAYIRRTRASGIALLASTVKASTTGGTTTSSAIDTTGATLIVIVYSSYKAGGTPTMSDSASNTWTRLTMRDSATNCKCTIFYKVAPTTSASHTFTTPVQSDFPVINVMAFSGTHASPFDAESGAAAASPGSITPATNGEVLIAGVTADTSGTFSIDSSFSITGQAAYDGATHMGGSGAYLIQGTAAAVNPTWSKTGGFSEVSSAMAAFKAA